MKYYLSREAVLKWLETPSVYHVKNDELYELDMDSFSFLRDCSESGCHSQNEEFIDYCLKQGLIDRKRVALKRPHPIKSPEPSLRYLELQITNRCNLTCRHCYIDDRGPRELPLKKLEKILKEFEQMQGLRILITGGEPMLHSQFEDINKMLPQFFLRKVLLTNGTLLNKARIKRLNVDEIQISIDGLEDAHDSLRGKGTFRLAIKAVQLALDQGFHISIATMIHPQNLGDFEEMDRLFKNMGIKEWAVDVPCVTGRLKENAEFQIRPEIGGRYLKYGYGGGLHTASPDFACGLHLMAIMADGTVAKCTFYSNSVVGSFEEGLRECWKKIEPIRLDDLKCDCEYIESCRGGCRYRAGLSGDPLGKDLDRCALYCINDRLSI